ncbi:hypothetical protein D3C80_2156780 [compost metagenome]
MVIILDLPWFVMVTLVVVAVTMVEQGGYKPEETVLIWAAVEDHRSFPGIMVQML